MKGKKKEKHLKSKICNLFSNNCRVLYHFTNITFTTRSKPCSYRFLKLVIDVKDLQWKEVDSTNHFKKFLDLFIFYILIQIVCYTNFDHCII